MRLVGKAAVESDLRNRAIGLEQTRKRVTQPDLLVIAMNADAHHPLEDAARVKNRYAGHEVPRPAHWGGYRVMATSFEFWMPHAGRLNERILFMRTDFGWQRTRLAP